MTESEFRSEDIDFARLDQALAALGIPIAIWLASFLESRTQKKQEGKMLTHLWDELDMNGKVVSD